MASNTWTEDKIQSVTEMVSSCMPSAKIAKAMTDIYNHIFSKNSIISICRRAGIKFPGARSIKKKTRRRGSARMRMQVANYKSIVQESDFLKPFQEYHGEEKSILDLGTKECRFPLEAGDSHVFCGRGVNKLNYCKYHYDICYKNEPGPVSPGY